MHCIFKRDFLALGAMLDLISLVACFERFFAPTREMFNQLSWQNSLGSTSTHENVWQLDCAKTPGC